MDRIRGKTPIEVYGGGMDVIGPILKIIMAHQFKLKSTVKCIAVFLEFLGFIKTPRDNLGAFVGVLRAILEAFV